MSTSIASLFDAISFNPGIWFGIGYGMFAFGLVAGGLIATVLWFRWYIDGSLDVLQAVANAEYDE